MLRCNSYLHRDFYDPSGGCVIPCLKTSTIPTLSLAAFLVSFPSLCLALPFSSFPSFCFQEPYFCTEEHYFGREGNICLPCAVGYPTPQAEGHLERPHTSCSSHLLIYESARGEGHCQKAQTRVGSKACACHRISARNIQAINQSYGMLSLWLVDI